MVTPAQAKRSEKMLDYGSLSEQELADISQAALQEIERRRNETELPEHIERLAGLYQQAIGRVEGAPWVQPMGAHDAYRQDATVTHNGHLWESAHPFNVWEPGTGDLWIDRGEASTPDPLPVDDYPVWEPGMAVKPGDPCVHDGILYTAIQAHTTEPGWTPDVVPALWKKVG